MNLKKKIPFRILIEIEEVANDDWKVVSYDHDTIKFINDRGKIFYYRY